MSGERELSRLGVTPYGGNCHWVSIWIDNGVSECALLSHNPISPLTFDGGQMSEWKWYYER